MSPSPYGDGDVLKLTFWKERRDIMWYRIPEYKFHDLLKHGCSRVRQVLNYKTGKCEYYEYIHI
jgi:hypothetical protein